MDNPRLYIIAGCNGAGKTTASMTVLLWLPSPGMAEERVATRVASGGHNIPKDIIHRRYWAGIRNLFDIFVPIVDFWSMYDNTEDSKAIVERNIIVDSDKFNSIKNICQNRNK